MSTTTAQRSAVKVARDALAEMPEHRDNQEPFFWLGRLKVSIELLLDAFDPRTARQQPEHDSDVQPNPYIDAIAAEHAEEYEPECWQCGATQAAAPLIESPEGGDWQCSNRQMCAGRQARRAAARDADTAKARCGSPATCAEFGHEHPHIDDATAKAGAQS